MKRHKHKGGKEDGMKELCDIPIDPKVVFEAVKQAALGRDRFAEEHVVTPTRHVSVRSEAFVLIREIARAIAEGTAWNKKARIVLEYDPQAERMEIDTFMASDELPPQGDPESP